MIDRHPCLLPLAYTVAVIIGVIVVVAKEGPWLWMVPGCDRTNAPAGSPADVEDVGWRARYSAVYNRATVEWLNGEMEKHAGNPKVLKDLEDRRALALHCADRLDAVVASQAGLFNWHEAGSICFWAALLLVPGWVLFYRRTRATSGLTVEQVEALAKRLPR